MNCIYVNCAARKTSASSSASMWKCSAKTKASIPRSYWAKRHHRNRNPGRRQALHRRHRHPLRHAGPGPPPLRLQGAPEPLAVAGHAQERLSHLPEPQRARHRRAGIGRLWPSNAKETHPRLSQLGLLRAIQRKRLRLRLAIDGARRHLLPLRACHGRTHPGAVRRHHASHGALPGGESIPFYPRKKPPQAIRKTSTPGSWSRKSSRAAITSTTTTSKAPGRTVPHAPRSTGPCARRP